MVDAGLNAAPNSGLAIVACQLSEGLLRRLLGALIQPGEYASHASPGPPSCGS
jgi:hypothetical protein